MRTKVPLKGEPDFTRISDTRLSECMDCIQALVFAYKYEDPETARVLEKVHSDLSNEALRAVMEMPYEEVPKVKSSLMKNRTKVKKWNKLKLGT